MPAGGHRGSRISNDLATGNVKRPGSKIIRGAPGIASPSVSETIRTGPGRGRHHITRQKRGEHARSPWAISRDIKSPVEHAGHRNRHASALHARIQEGARRPAVCGVRHSLLLDGAWQEIKPQSGQGALRRNSRARGRAASACHLHHQQKSGGHSPWGCINHSPAGLLDPSRQQVWRTAPGAR